MEIIQHFCTGLISLIDLPLRCDCIESAVREWERKATRNHVWHILWFIAPRAARTELPVGPRLRCTRSIAGAKLYIRMDVYPDGFVRISTRQIHTHDCRISFQWPIKLMYLGLDMWKSGRASGLSRRWTVAPLSPSVHWKVSTGVIFWELFG